MNSTLRVRIPSGINDPFQPPKILKGVLGLSEKKTLKSLVERFNAPGFED